ncbi:MAG: sigma-70 family RNA polymerase sigma factor [Myxococcota bacterium]
MQDDFELLEQWRGGSTAAGSQLLQRYFDNLYRFFSSKVDDEVEDLIQLTMLACVRYQRSLERVQSFRAYLFTVARNELFRHLRGRAKRDVVDFGTASVVDLGISPTSIVARRQQQARLVTALRGLPVELQLLLELHYWEGLSTSELADVVDAPQGTVKSRLRRAKAQLAELLASDANPEFVDPRGGDAALASWVKAMRLTAGQLDDEA